MRYNKDGWLYSHNDTNRIHYISHKNIFQLLELAKDDDDWSKRVRDEVNYVRQNPSLHPSDWLREEYLIRNTAGAVIHYPFGNRVIVFNSRRHFFRGENQIFKSSLPSLNRKLIGKDQREQELLRAIANLRVFQFASFIWNIDVVPYWNAKLSDVNYKALAQHYGFDTHLLDLTNDFKVALFFATCRYVPETDSYIPLTKKMIEENEDTKYGVIYHSPNWILDFSSPGGCMEWLAEHVSDVRERPYGLDSGDVDGMAFQIGFQPFMRCHHQSGYIFPLRKNKPLQDDNRFEILRFKHSPELSNKIFEMMHGGRKIFPFEGISELGDVLAKIRNATIFSEEDIEYVYCHENVNKEYFPTLEDLKNALLGFKCDGKNIEIVKHEVTYSVSDQILSRINSRYNNMGLLSILSEHIIQKPDDKKYREQKCIEIYGKLI